MKTFYEHHQDTIPFTYRCFDRIWLDGLIQRFQQPERRHAACHHRLFFAQAE